MTSLRIIVVTGVMLISTSFGAHSAFGANNDAALTAVTLEDHKI